MRLEFTGQNGLGSEPFRTGFAHGVEARLEGNDLTIVSSVQTISPVIVRGRGKGLPATLKVNGTTRKVSANEWKNGWNATPAPQYRLRHRPLSALTAENAVITVDVWPHANTKDSTVAFQAWLGDKMVFQQRKPLRVKEGRGVSFQVPARVFKPGVQTMRYYVMPLEHNWDTEWPADQPFQTTVVAFNAGREAWSDTLTGALDPAWRLERPGGSVAEATPSGLQLTVPDEGLYDQWVDKNDAPKALRAVPRGPWSFSTHLQTGGLPPAGNYQAGLLVQTGANQFAMFGPASGSDMRLEFTGQNGLGSEPFRTGFAHGVELRARFDGKTLWFDARPDGGAWTQPMPMTAPDAPTHAGVFLKTWEPLAVTATFDNARMETLAAE
jgi:hypothetical protein